MEVSRYVFCYLDFGEAYGAGCGRTHSERTWRSFQKDLADMLSDYLVWIDHTASFSGPWNVIDLIVRLHFLHLAGKRVNYELLNRASQKLCLPWQFLPWNACQTNSASLFSLSQRVEPRPCLRSLPTPGPWTKFRSS